MTISPTLAEGVTKLGGIRSVDNTTGETGAVDWEAMEESKPPARQSQSPPLPKMPTSPTQSAPASPRRASPADMVEEGSDQPQPVGPPSSSTHSLSHFPRPLPIPASSLPPAADDNEEEMVVPEPRVPSNRPRPLRNTFVPFPSPPRPAETARDRARRLRQRADAALEERNNKRRIKSILNAAHGPDDSDPDDKGQPVRKKVKPQQSRCSSCGQEGHMHLDCPEGLDPCARCGRYGHEYEKCPVVQGERRTEQVARATKKAEQDPHSLAERQRKQAIVTRNFRERMAALAAAPPPPPPPSPPPAPPAPSPTPSPSFLHLTTPPCSPRTPILIPMPDLLARFPFLVWPLPRPMGSEEGEEDEDDEEDEEDEEGEESEDDEDEDEIEEGEEEDEGEEGEEEIEEGESDEGTSDLRREMG